MLGQKPVRAVGLNLGLRLYLVLVAIFLPTFLSYCVYTIRTIEMLHETEVEDVIRMTSLRLEDWAFTFGSLDNPVEKEPEAQAKELQRIAREREAKAKELLLNGKESDPEALELLRSAKELDQKAQALLRSAKEREALTHELRRIVSESNGIEGLSLFCVSADGLLAPVAAHGPSALGKPVAEDADALTQRKQLKIDVLRGDRPFQSVSVPIRVKGEVRGVLHLEVVPTKIGLGLRIREVKANLLLGATGLVLAVGFGVALFFHYAVRRPIRQLS